MTVAGDFDPSHEMLVLGITPTQLVHRGVCDSKNANHVFRFITAWVTLLKDSPLLATSGPKPRRTIRKFLADLLSRPLLETVIAYSSLGDMLISYPHVTDHGSEKGPWIPMHNTPVFKEYYNWYHEGDVACFSYLLTFLWFGKKMDYENEDFYSTAFRGWVDIEDKLASLELPCDVSTLSTIVKYVLGPLSKTPLAPKFGPGYVSERGVFGIIKKTDVKYDAKLDRVFFTNSVFVSNTEKEEMGYDPERVIPSLDTWDPSGEHSTKHSRLKFVPKNVKTARSICMEPNAYMFMQQALLQRVLDSIRSSRLSRFIDLRDQTRNQYLAEYGSLTNRIDTIDLSSASDSLSLNLVKALFPRDWLYFMLGTRTSQVELPDGTLRTINKFAPMGSALCFPTQCIVFTCVVLQAAIYYVYGQERVKQDGVSASMIEHTLSLFNDKPNLTEGFMPLATYGDDIAVDSKLTAGVTELLTKYGFRVNSDKSFRGDQCFRESCGKYYLEGIDVTPVFFKLPSFQENPSAADIFAIIGQCNYSFDSYKAYRRYLLSILLRHVPKVRFTKDPKDTSAVRTGRHVINHHLKRRWNTHLQRYEWRHAKIGVSETIYPTSGEKDKVDKYLYVQWHRAAPRELDGGEVKLPALRGVAADYRIVWGWTPDYT